MSFDTSRFGVLLRARLKRLLPHTSEPAIQSLAQDALKRLHIFQPKSSTQLAATIYHLPKYLGNHLSNRQIGLVGIDSISAFYWPDRFTTQQIRAAREGASPPYGHPLSHVFTALQSLHLHYSPITVLTNWGLILDPEHSTLLPVFKQHLHPFPGLLTQSSPNGLVSTAHATNETLKVSCQITLSQALSPRNAVSHKLTAKTRDRVIKSEVIAVIRYPGNSGANTSYLEIWDDDMVVL
ncbi:hypothetical protein AX15_006666 [Amanita polypyramis BW_CC]|nr:hypothetical protein AX15_006666 [Amanita polypyramis BW_CC]